MFTLPILFALSVPMPVFADGVMEPKMPTLWEEHKIAAPTESGDSCVREASISFELERILELTNLERVGAGLRPLKLNAKLCAAAEWMAGDMAQNGYFDHQDRSGRRVGDRAFDFGYRAWSVIGENMAAGAPTAEAAVQEWLSSPSHRRNVMKPEFTEMGIGLVRDPDSRYRTYWVQTFGAQPDYVASRWR